MRTIFVHRFSGILSAVGIGLADDVAEEQVCFIEACDHYARAQSLVSPKGFGFRGFKFAWVANQ